MDAADSWRQLFCEWPEAIPRQGIIVTTFGETLPFQNFMLAGGLLLVERDRPDGAGARKVVLDFSGIAAVKFTSPMDLDQYRAMGFE